MNSQPFFLPGLSVQDACADAQHRIDLLRNELLQLEHIVWEQPTRIEATATSLRMVNRKEGFNDWVDTLPFPLGSILWSYAAMGSDHQRRYERLIQFFEGLAQFCATLQLSALSSNATFWLDGGVKDKLLTVLSREHLSIEHSTFGTWKAVTEVTSKETRKLLNNKPAECYSLYCTEHRRVLETISSKRIVTIIAETNRLRNEWQGHTGAIGRRDAIVRHESLRELLVSVQKEFGIMWSDYQMIRPESSRYDGKTHLSDCHLLVGSRTPFRQIEVETEGPLVAAGLYLWSPGQTRALRLLPLIKIMPSPRTQENACYFFNRTKGDVARFLSYHFEADSEVTLPSDDMTKTLTGLGLTIHRDS